MSATIRELVAFRVRSAREAAGITQRELAERTNLGPEVISRIERGIEALTLENLHRISTALGIRYGWLFDVDEPPTLDDADVREILRLLKCASVEEVKMVRRVVNAMIGRRH